MEKFVIESNGSILKLTICESTRVDREAVKILYRILYDDQRKLLVLVASSASIEKEAKDFMNRVGKFIKANSLSVITETFNDHLQVNS